MCYKPDFSLWFWAWAWNPPTWPCLIVEVLAKLFDPSGNCTGINSIFLFCTTNVFGCICSIMAQFELLKYKFLNLTILHVHLYSFQIINGMKQCTMCQCTNYHNTTLKGLYCFRYASQTSTYESIAKLLTHPSIWHFVERNVYWLTLLEINQFLFLFLLWWKMFVLYSLVLPIWEFSVRCHFTWSNISLKNWPCVAFCLWQKDWVNMRVK